MLGDIVRWWAVLGLLGALALPVTTWFFRHLPDRGIGFAKPLGLLIVTYLAWLASMLGIGSFRRLELILAALFMVVVGLALHQREGAMRAVGSIRARWAVVVLHELLFLTAFGFCVWLRWHDFIVPGPALLHTEQSMDLALLSGVLVSEQFPPQDPWLSGYPINYYYFGYALVAALIQLAGTSVGEGYTLGIATIFGLTATVAAGIASNLVLLTRRGKSGTNGDALASRESDWSPSRPAAPRLLISCIAGLVGVLFVLIAGNQAAALQLLAGSPKVVALSPGEMGRAIYGNLSGRDAIELSPTFPVDDFDGESLIVSDNRLDRDSFDRWWPSRVVWDDLEGFDGVIRRYQNITEFPYFSFLLGDLHPHVLSLPWSLLALACALNLVAARPSGEHLSAGSLVGILISALSLGALYAINAWDVPTYALIYLGALLLHHRKSPQIPWRALALHASITIIAAYVLFMPFHRSFSPPIGPDGQFPLALVETRTGFVEFFIVFGLFFVPLLALLAHVVSRLEPGTIALRLISQRRVPLLLVAIFALGLLAHWHLFALLPLGMWAGLVAFDRAREPAPAFVLWLFAVGCFVVWAVDVVYLRDVYASPRTNTVFKFYYQTWIVWGVASAYAVVALARRLGPTAALWMTPTTALLVGAMVYPVLAPALATTPRTVDFPTREIVPRTLDGLGYLPNSAPGEAAVIGWILQNTQADAVIVQAPGNSDMHGHSRLSTATGRPTVLGWKGHESVWRRGQPAIHAQLTPREEDLRVIYTSVDEQQALTLLEKYNASYVYVGGNERALVLQAQAPAAALTKFDAFMTRVFEQDGAILYAMR